MIPQNSQEVHRDLRDPQKETKACKSSPATLFHTYTHVYTQKKNIYIYIDIYIYLKKHRCIYIYMKLGHALAMSLCVISKDVSFEVHAHCGALHVLGDCLYCPWRNYSIWKSGTICCRKGPGFACRSPSEVDPSC